jgi:hypothetical protein
MADDFAASEGRYDAIAVTSQDGQFGHSFIDPELARRWWDWHGARANIRPVSKRANLGVLRRGVPKHPRS